MTTLLALDTATEACSVALLHDGKVLSHYEVIPRLHAQRLLPMIKTLLADAFYYKDEKGGNVWVSPTEVKVERDDKGRITKAVDNVNTEILSEIQGMDALDQRERLLDLGFARVDLRTPEEVAVRPSAVGA